MPSGSAKQLREIFSDKRCDFIQIVYVSGMVMVVS